MIVTPKRRQRASLCAPLGALLVNPFTALFGPRITYFRMTIPLGIVTALTVLSELFGVSEDEIPEFDHSEDSENGV